MVGRGNSHKNPRRNEQDIMYKLMTQGPVQAIMEVYTDFFMYASGIYKKTNLASKTVEGYHAVRGESGQGKGDLQGGERTDIGRDWLTGERENCLD